MRDQEEHLMERMEQKEKKNEADIERIEADF